MYKILKSKNTVMDRGRDAPKERFYFLEIMSKRQETFEDVNECFFSFMVKAVNVDEIDINQITEENIVNNILPIININTYDELKSLLNIIPKNIIPFNNELNYEENYKLITINIFKYLCEIGNVYNISEWEIL